MLKKLGLQKFLMVIVFGVIFINFVSSLFTVAYMQSSISSLINSSRGSVQESNSIINLSINISSVQSWLSALLTEKDPDKIEASIANVQNKMKEVKKELLACTFDCKTVTAIYADYEKKVDELINKRILLGKTSEAIEYYIGDVSPIYMKTLAEFDRLSNELGVKTGNVLKNSEAEAHKLKIVIGASSFFLILLISVGGLSFRKSIVSALNSISEQLKSNTEALKETSVKVATTSDFLSESSTQQNVSIQSTSQAVHEISAMTEVNRKNVLLSTQNSEESQNKIKEGKLAISNMLTSIENINRSNESMIEQIQKNDKEFGEVISLIREIDTKTKIINDIVFQTKLLSFNASVEAARAGDHGKGFSVVAEEIGNLAVMSGQAAHEISHLLNNSVKRVNDIVKHSQVEMENIVETGKITINEGTKSAHNCHHIFDLISEDSNYICSTLKEINTGTIEQSKGIEEVNKSMHQLNDVANKGEEIALESFEMSAQLKDQSEVLGKIVDELVTMIDGSKAS